ILERYRTSTGYSGMSINFYHAALGEWHQTWIDNQGAPIEMKGGIEDGRMVMRWTPSEGRAARMTWTPMEDGTVRQHWEFRDEGEELWQTAFDGIYRPKPH
ncbi:MAG: hypothetical protein OEY63_06010, partial [Gemmatimonadota bacterium]|nr:hypothetical protein [Gemmatimonadota bacterium]